MRKHGWKFLVLIILAALVFIWLIKAPLMSAYFSRKLQVPVSITNISLWPSQSIIRNFRIENPSGFKTTSALKVDRTEVDYQFNRLRGKVSEIDQILMEGVYLSIECSNPVCSSNNWTAIGEKMPKENRQTREVIVHKMVLTDITIEIRGLALLGKPVVIKRFDRMEFNEVDSRTGFPTKQLIQKIFGGAGIQQYIENFFNVPQNAIQQFMSPLKRLGGENEELKKKPSEDPRAVEKSTLRKRD